MEIVLGIAIFSVLVVAGTYWRKKKREKLNPLSYDELPVEDRKKGRK